jgi:hypothetical protein
MLRGRGTNRALNVTRSGASAWQWMGHSEIYPAIFNTLFPALGCGEWQHVCTCIRARARNKGERAHTKMSSHLRIPFSSPLRGVFKYTRFLVTAYLPLPVSHNGRFDGFALRYTNSSHDAFSEVTLEHLSFFFFFCNLVLFAICTSTFSKLCKNIYTVACRRVLSRAPL